MEHEPQPISSVDRLNLIRSIKKTGGKTSEWREKLCAFFEESPDERLPLLDLQELDLLHLAGHIDDGTFSRRATFYAEQLIESPIEMNEL